MIPISIIIGVCLALVAVNMAAKKTGGKKKAKAKPKKTGLEVIGVHHDHIRVGKATVASGLVVAAIDGGYIHEGITYSPSDIILGKGVWANYTMAQRAEHAAKVFAYNLTGSKTDDAVYLNPETAGRAGKVIVAGGVTHIIGNVKFVKKLTRGLPLRP